MAIQVTGSNGLYKLFVDAFNASYARLRGKNGNDLALAAGENVASTQEYLLTAGLNDSFATPFRVDRLGNVIIGNALSELSELSDGTTIHPLKWTATVSGFAQAQTVNGINLCNTASTAANSYSILLSQAFFPKSPRIPLQFKARWNQNIGVGSLLEAGFGSPVTNTTLVQGAFFRSVANSVTPFVINSTGLEVVGIPVDLTAYITSALVYDVIIDDDNALFTIHDTENDVWVTRQAVKIPRAWMKMFAAARLQAFIRVMNGAAIVGTSPIARISEAIVISHDLQQNRPFGLIQSLNRMASNTNPLTGVTTANGTNSAAPASGALSNTAGSYGVGFLDGKFQFAAVAGVETDYCLFGFTVPTGYRFVCTGFEVSAFNMGAASATSVTTLNWSLGENGASVNLSTGAHLRHEIGEMSLPIGAAIGATFDKPLSVKFNLDAPLITESGRNFATILKIPSGAATPSQIIRGRTKVYGYFI
jgi:hypothetical protein